MSYICSMCKNLTEGSVAFKNGAGEFCPSCKATIHARAANAMRSRNAALNGHCLWCGEKITPANMQPGKENEHVCKTCDMRRNWLLKVIRISDRPARYVMRTEERERPIREEREKTKHVVAQPTLVTSEVPNEHEDRLRRLEHMLNQLTQALGV